jgi:hypothetical protein
LAIKPHDVGLIWLYFLLAGRTQRKRAIQAGALAVALALIGALWTSRVAPHWASEFRSNLATISAPGGINEPGPTSIGVGSPDMIIDLQTVVSIFQDDPRIYNPVTYAICGIILLSMGSRSSFVRDHARECHSSRSCPCAALSMLVTYHRSYDAKLLLLSVPACAMLWVEGGTIAWMALLIGMAGVVFTGRSPLGRPDAPHPTPVFTGRWIGWKDRDCRGYSPGPTHPARDRHFLSVGLSYVGLTKTRAERKRKVHH